jgi:serine phosphatase RsbU (regulator of sigma subunit)
VIDSFVAWAVAQKTLAGQNKSGDGYLVKRFGNCALIAVVDGLGHGEEAAVATKIAVDQLQANPHDNVISLLERIHKALRKTRGVVMSVALVNDLDATATWTGIGNVEGLFVRANPDIQPQKEFLLTRAGIVGGQLPALRPSIMPIMPGDTIAFATDGILTGFAEEVNSHDAPSEIAATIIAKHAKGSDDALVLVARYLGHHL